MLCYYWNYKVTLFNYMYKEGDWCLEDSRINSDKLHKYLLQ